VPTAAQFEAFAQGLGIHNDSVIVVIDHKYDATRLWWLFRYFGHDSRAVRVLDGGMQRWLREGLPTTTNAPPTAAAGTWAAPARATDEMLASREQVRALRTELTPRLWDVRTVAEHEGTKTMPGARQPGRIPWSTRRVDWDVFRMADCSWRSVGEVGPLPRHWKPFEDGGTRGCASAAAG
jgi:thiosulfate/3-mercaptopyruvate sulfurtransferase